MCRQRTTCAFAESGRVVSMLVLAVGLSICISTRSATTNNWINSSPGGGDYAASANWAPNIVPPSPKGEGWGEGKESREFPGASNDRSPVLLLKSKKPTRASIHWQIDLPITVRHQGKRIRNGIPCRGCGKIRRCVEGKSSRIDRPG